MRNEENEENLIIDFHAHIYPDKIAEKVITSLEKEYGFKARAMGTANGLLKSMEALINFSVILPVALHPNQVKSINNWISKVSQEHNEFIGFGTVHPKMKNFDEEIRRISHDLGLYGIKLQPNEQNFYPNDEKFLKFYEYCLDFELMVLIHAGHQMTPRTPVFSTPTRLREVIETFPELLIVLPHLGGYKMWAEVEMNLSGFKNVYFDTSYVFGFLEEEKTIELIKKLGVDHIIFGTDFPWRNHSEELEKVNQMSFSKEEKRKILGINAKKILKLDSMLLE